MRNVLGLPGQLVARPQLASGHQWLVAEVGTVLPPDAGLRGPSLQLQAVELRFDQMSNGPGTGNLRARLPRETLAEKKLRWFHVGARDLALTLPGLITELGSDYPPIYACPLCAASDRIMTFPASALAEGTLTADHVPPKHVRGRLLVLTCRTCNNTQGHQVDSVAADVERGQRFLTGRGGDARASFRVGDFTLNGRLTVDQSAVSFKAFPNRPDIVRGFSETLATQIPGGNIDVTFSLPDISNRLARASWLKSAFLAMFAGFGYRYALNPALEVVRRQIREPSEQHIPDFCIRLPGDIPFAECRIFRIRDSSVPAAWGVQMGPWLVLLPADETGALYPRISELKSQKARFEYLATDSWWPTQPIFAMAPRLAPSVYR